MSFSGVRRSLATLLFLFLSPAPAGAVVPACQDALRTVEPDSLRSTDKVVSSGRVRLDKLSPDTELSVYRFFGSSNMESARVAAYKISNGHFEPKQVGTLALNDRYVQPDGKGTKLLSMLQDFSLWVMEKDNYAKPGQRERQRELIQNFSPEQPTYFEMSEPVLRSEVESHPEKYPDEVRGLRPDIERPDHVHIRKGAAWLVSAQYMYSNSGSHQGYASKLSASELHFRSEMPMESPQDFVPPERLVEIGFSPLPWMLNKQFAKSGNFAEMRTEDFLFRRSKYPLQWELGRAAKLEPRHFEAMMPSILAVVDEEIQTMLQSHPEDAYIFAKVMDPIRKRNFQRWGFEPVEGECEQPSSCVMVAPFLKLAARYDIGETSFRLQKIRELAGPGHSSADLMNVLRRVHTNFRAELDFFIPELHLKQDGPLVIHDVTSNYNVLQMAWAQFLGMKKSDIPEFVRLSASWRNDFTRKQDYLTDVPPLEPFVENFSQNRAVRISNLQARTASHPFGVAAALIGTDEYLLSRYHELGVNNAEEIFAQLKLHYVIQTSNAETLRWIRLRYPNHLVETVRVGGVPVHTIVFARDYVQALKAANPALVAPIHDGITQGRYFFRALSEQPLKF